MRHWHVIDGEGVSSFVITEDLQHPRDVGYPDDGGFSIARMAAMPEPFTTVEAGVIVTDSAALRDAQPTPLPRTQAELETLINARITAFSELQVNSG